MKISKRSRNKIILIISLALLLTVIDPPGPVFSQDAKKVVILSPRVGAAIDSLEREQFRLFGQIENYDSAFALKLAGDEYIIHFVQTPINGTEQSMTRLYSIQMLSTIAERINHFECPSETEYHSGGEAFQESDSLSPYMLEVSGKPVITTADVTPGALKRDFLSAEEATGIHLDIYPNAGFGLGLSSYSPDFSSLQPLYSAVEQDLITRGGRLEHYKVGWEIQCLLWWNMKLNFSKNLGIYTEIGSYEVNPHSSNRTIFKAFSINGVYQFYFNKIRWLRPFLSAGVTYYNIELEHDYGIVKIEVKGSSQGYNLSGGIEVLRGYWGLEPSLTIYGTYLFAPEVTKSYGDVSASFDFDKFIVGARITLYL